MRTKHSFLEDLALALVREYGEAATKAAVSKACVFASSSNRQAEPVEGDPVEQKKPISKRPSKPSAVDLASKAQEPAARKEVIFKIAESYDQKSFLPHAADIREFLILAGERPKLMKDRSDAFRQVLAVLNKLPQDRLRFVATTASNATSNQLSSISAAIRTAGESRRLDPLNRLPSHK